MGKKKKTLEVKEAAAAYGPGIEVSATDFKTHCLGLIDRIRQTGETLVVTRHGKPVARVEGFDPPGAAGVVGRLEGTVLFYEAPTEATGEEWDVGLDAFGEGYADGGE